MGGQVKVRGSVFVPRALRCTGGRGGGQKAALSRWQVNVGMGCSGGGTFRGVQKLQRQRCFCVLLARAHLVGAGRCEWTPYVHLNSKRHGCVV